MTPQLRQGALFVVVGGAATATHLTAALAARELLGQSPLIANFIGYVCAIGVSYLCNARLTFRARALDGAQLGRFLVVSLLGLLANQAIVHGVVDLLGLPFWAGLAAVVTLVPAMTFVLSRLWVFRRPA